ncbi:sugar ABC transporter permease [Aeromicrobium sp. Root344]|uniref:carbohydrate ABC transporter permease n=1 Tax=Aeromicrobium sp. Root344 TaxID=1736521 RepID=UPI0006FC94AB|nr:carbohydrate ABC transporter permease [Aeromicrobium sp. Root344]KQV73663.1 sugar ABC transporter permease [Aeromicrobium sp. Root344]
MSSRAVSRRPRTRLVQPVAALTLVAVVIGIPLWLVLVTSAKSQGDALNPSLALPTDGWHFLSNYRRAFTDGRVIDAFLGSVMIVVPAVVIVLLFGSMASWVLARRSSIWLSTIYAVAISGIVIPPAVITLVLLLRQISLAGTLAGMVLVYVGIYMSTAIFFITGFIRTIPHELEEAARVDGAGPIRIFFTIILPLLRPVLATATILICLYIWNDVFFAFFVVGGRMDTLPLNLFQVASAGVYLNNWNLIFAYVVQMSIPLLVVFVVAQRRIISGITGGAVK